MTSPKPINTTMDVYQWLKPKSRALDAEIRRLVDQVNDPKAAAAVGGVDIASMQLKRAVDARAQLYTVATKVADKIEKGEGPGGEAVGRALAEFDASTLSKDEAHFLLRARLNESRPTGSTPTTGHRPGAAGLSRAGLSSAAPGAGRAPAANAWHAEAWNQHAWNPFGGGSTPFGSAMNNYYAAPGGGGKGNLFGDAPGTMEPPPLPPSTPTLSALVGDFLRTALATPAVQEAIVSLAQGAATRGSTSTGDLKAVLAKLRTALAQDTRANGP